MVMLSARLHSYAPLDSFMSPPSGEFPVRIVDSELRSGRRGGAVLRLCYEICSGLSKGVRIDDLLPLWNTNPTVMEQALRRLKSIVGASGCPDRDFLADSAELHGRCMMVRVALLRDREGRDHTAVTSYRPLNHPPFRKERLRPVPPAQAAGKYFVPLHPDRAA